MELGDSLSAGMTLPVAIVAAPRTPQLTVFFISVVLELEVRQFHSAVPHTLKPGPRVALIAARLGPTRLIDNLEFAVG